MVTQRLTEVWLITQQIENLCKNELPSEREAVSLLKNYQNKTKLTLKNALNSTIDDVMKQYGKE